MIKLASLSKGFESQKVLLEVEDALAEEYCVSLLDSGYNKKYLGLTSLPFCFDSKLPKVKLESLWQEALACGKCKNSVVERRTMATGNLQAKYFVIGDAPGVGDGAKETFDRAFAYGQSSHLLRKALLMVGIYAECWMTNILKCGMPENAQSTPKQIDKCIYYLENEVSQIKPESLILLGSHVSDVISERGLFKNIKRIKVYHPAYYVRRGNNYKKYAEHLKDKLSCILQ